MHTWVPQSLKKEMEGSFLAQSGMAAYYGQEAKLEELREWYDGYRFGSTEIYNPWSVANYFYNNCQAKPYWTNTSDNEIIREIMISLTPDIAENLFAPLQGQTVQASLNMDVIFMEGLEKALYLNDGKKFQEFLRKYMITCISCFDGAAEGFYHGMMLVYLHPPTRL